MRACSLVLVLVAAGCQRDLTPGPQPGAPAHLAQVQDLRGFPVDGEHVVVDLRPAPAYAAGHVPGAVHLEVKALRAEVEGVPEQLAPRAQVEAALAAAGVDVGDEVVAVDEDGGPPAARLVWTLQAFGHDPARLRVLDGGWKAWVAADAPQSTAPAAPAPAERPVGATQPRWTVDAAWVRDHLGDPQVLLLDVRSDEEWQAGHIPGAQHVPWQAARAEDGRLQDPDALRELYAPAMAAPTVAVYCKSGMRASVTWLVLRTLGHPDVRVYDGSWNEWGARPDLPKES